MTRKKIIKEAAADHRDCVCCGFDDPTADAQEESFIAGAESENKRLVDKACDWLYDNFYEHPHEKNFICSENFATVEDMIAWFQIIMEE